VFVWVAHGPHSELVLGPEAYKDSLCPWEPTFLFIFSFYFSAKTTLILVDIYNGLSGIWNTSSLFL